MTAGTPSTKISQAVRKVGDEYRTNGYEVAESPSSENLPKFLQGFEPDLIARKGAENVVVQIRTRQHREGGDKELERLAALIQRHKNWRLELRILEGLVPKSQIVFEFASASNKRLSPVELRKRVAEARELAANDRFAVSLLLLWTAIEGYLRLIAKNRGLGFESDTPRAIAKQMYASGVVGRDEYETLSEALPLRNSVVHGFEPPRASLKVRSGELMKIAERLRRLYLDSRSKS